MLMMLLTILILALWLLKYRDTKNLAFASSWYVGALFPTSNILFAIGTIFGERLYYLPSVGFCLCLAILWDMVARRCVEGWTIPRARSGKAALGFALGMILALGLATWLRNPVWSNDRSLFEDTVARAPLNAKARLWLADSLVRSGDSSASVAEYRKALEIFPEYGAPAANMIVPLLRLNRLSEAIETGEKARALFPEVNAVVLYNLGLAYLKAGDQARFLEYMQGVLKVDPQNSDAELQMGMFYLQHEKNGQEARKHLMEALRLNPNSQHASEIRRWLSEFR
jgi:tetratricopeptide (TPR) repeat protein